MPVAPSVVPVTRGALGRLMRRALPASVQRHGWSPWHGVCAAVLLLVGLAATSDAWADIHRIALRDEEAGHIFLVPLVVACLFWVRRTRLRVCHPRGTWVGPLLVAAGWLLHSVGDAHMFQAFWHAGAIAIVTGCLLSVAGIDVLKRFFPCFLALVFLVPVPGAIRQLLAAPVQNVTAQLTHGVLELLGGDVVLAGNVLCVNGVEVAVAEACNGLRMVFALGLVSFVFAFGCPLRQSTRVLVLLASPVTAVLFNVVRLVPTVWLYGHAPANVARFAHDLSGWVMLPVAFLALVGLVRLLRWFHVPVSRFTLAYGT